MPRSCNDNRLRILVTSKKASYLGAFFITHNRGQYSFFSLKLNSCISLNAQSLFCLKALLFEEALFFITFGKPKIRIMKYISFKTLRKSRAVIIRQPFISTVRFPSGNNKGKIKSQHKCQYNEEQTTIRMDEQVSPDPNLAVLPTPLFIMRGIRNVGEDENLIIDALRAHPDNIANGGKLFKEYDISTEELLQLEGFDKEDECKQLLKTSEANIVRSCAVWFLGNKFLSKDISTNTMKLALRRAIEMNVEVPGTDGAVFVDAFMAFMKDKGNSEKLLAALAIQEGILNITGGRKIVWGDTNELVFNGSQAQEVVREFAIWMKNDKEGREIAKILSEKVKTIKDN